MKTKNYHWSDRMTKKPVLEWHCDHEENTLSKMVNHLLSKRLPNKFLFQFHYCGNPTVGIFFKTKYDRISWAYGFQKCLKSTRELMEFDGFNACWKILRNQ